MPPSTRILLIEDFPADARQVQELLLQVEKSGRLPVAAIHFERVSRLATGLARLQKSTADLVLVDLSLPDAPGLPAVAQLCRAFPDLAVVAWVAPGEEALALQALEQGAWDYLVKGQVTSDLLARVLRCALQRKELESRLRETAMRDDLTGLFSRVYFDEELRRLEFSRLYPISILIADLDQVQAFFVKQGRGAGEGLIKRAAVLLRQFFRSEDVVARIGSGRFAVVMPRTNARSAAKVMQRLIDRLEEATRQDPSQPLVVSLGIATAGQGHSLLETLKEADVHYYDGEILNHAGLSAGA